MSDKKISQLDSASPLDGTEVLPLVQNGTTVKATLDDVLGLVPPIAWGNITGTITDQTDLISYLGSNYVPSTREITINGTTYDLSADRSWTIATATETLAQTLAAGNTSGSYDILMNTAQRVGFKDGDNTYTTYLSNNQSQAANRTVYLPVYNGTLTYKTTNLTSNYILKGTTNEAIVSSSLIYDKIGRAHV